MDKGQQTKTSRFLSLVLRHQPQKIGIELAANGWVGVQELLRALHGFGVDLDREMLEYLVRENDKRRFEFCGDGTKIRASQGHSVAVDLGYQAMIPPDQLCHGTVERFLDGILKIGLVKGQRHHVHLSESLRTAQDVGRRRGEARILLIAAGKMHSEGHEFYQSTNGVWLVSSVPPEYIRLADPE